MMAQLKRYLDLDHLRQNFLDPCMYWTTNCQGYASFYVGQHMGCIYTSILIAYVYVMRGSRKFCQRGSNYDKVFFLVLCGGGGRIQIPLLAGHQRPACETPFKWRFAGGLIIAQHGMLAW